MDGYWSKQFAKDENGKTLVFLHLGLDDTNKFIGEIETNIPPYLFELEEVKLQMRQLEGTRDRKEIDKIGGTILTAICDRPEILDLILPEQYLDKNGDVNLDLYNDEGMQTNEYTINKAYSIHEESTAFDDLKHFIYFNIGFPWGEKSEITRETFEALLKDDADKLVYAEIFESGLEYHVFNSERKDNSSALAWAGIDGQMLFAIIIQDEA